MIYIYIYYILIYCAPSIKLHTHGAEALLDRPHSCLSFIEDLLDGECMNE